MSAAPHSLGCRWWAAVLGAAALLRLVVAFALLRTMPLVSDARDYFDLAAHLAEKSPVGAFYWPPGESLTLAVPFAFFGPKLAVARLVTVAMSVGFVAVAALLAEKVGGARAARAAGWMAVVYAPSVALCGQTYAQHLAALCLAALAYFGLRALREHRPLFFLLSGLALGLGYLTRPSMVSVAPVLVLAGARMAWRDAASRRALALGGVLAACTSFAVVLPVLIHDRQAGAGWTVSTNNERNLFLGNNPYTPDYKTSHLGQRALDELAPDARLYLESMYKRPDARSAMQHEALAYMADHPFRTLLRTFNRAIAFWGFDYLASREIQRWRGWSTRAALPLIALEAGSYAVAAILALAALLTVWHAGDRACVAWLLGLTLAYEVPYAIAFSGGTYHFPVMPMILAIAGLSVAHAKEVRRRLVDSRAAYVAMAAFALIQAQYAYCALEMRG